MIFDKLTNRWKRIYIAQYSNIGVLYTAGQSSLPSHRLEELCSEYKDTIEMTMV
jgi:hypothetical protein